VQSDWFVSPSSHVEFTAVQLYCQTRGVDHQQCLDNNRHADFWLVGYGSVISVTSPTALKNIMSRVRSQAWENHHCEKHGNTQISSNLSHKLWKRLALGMPGRSYQTKPGLPSGCQVNIKCFYAKSTCLGSNNRNISSLTLVQKVIPGYLQRTVEQLGVLELHGFINEMLRIP
jgi:hypothetical protein